MRVKEFYDRVTEGMALQELWSQFKSEAQSSYRFYSDTVDWETLQRLPAWKRILRIGWAFFWTMLMFLSPVRRVILLIALIFLLAGMAGIPRNRPALVAYGGLALMLVLALELADRVTMKRDLEIAREIQRWLVPEVPPQLETADIAFATRPANTVGGDFYDVIRHGDETPRGKVLLAVADVAGKSVPAAILMATFQASLRSLMVANPSLEALASGLNRGVCERSQGGRRFTTAFLGEFSPDTGALDYINAGHNFPILMRQSGAIERPQEGGLPFGIQMEAGYKLQGLQLSSGDVLVVFTDGVVEAVNARGEEFGDDRLLSVVAKSQSLGAADLLASLNDSVGEFVGSTRQHDDMTWLVLKIRK